MGGPKHDLLTVKPHYINAPVASTCVILPGVSGVLIVLTTLNSEYMLASTPHHMAQAVMNTQITGHYASCSALAHFTLTITVWRG